jgi:hypothetical protein
MERPEFAANLYASAMAVAEGYRVLEDPGEEARFVDLAARIERAVLEKMWHDEEGFFHPLWAAEDCPVPYREITGSFPLFHRLVPDDPGYLDAMELLLDPIMNPLGGFRSPAVTIAKPHGWHGTIFPRDVSVVVECLANYLGHDAPAVEKKSAISDLLRAYTKLHFHKGEPGSLVLRRSYDIQHRTVQGEFDVFQSSYNDLIIRYVAGLVPRMDDVIEVWPIVDDLDHFRLEGVIYHGRRLDITWDKPDGDPIYPPLPEGFSLHVDGELAFNEPELMRKLHAMNDSGR